MAKAQEPAGTGRAVLPLKKGSRLVLSIESLGPGGEGVSRAAGLPVFVERVAPGDVVEIELFDVRKDFARARVVRLVEASAQRAEPPCRLFGVCGGCQWQHLAYEHQLAAKTHIVRQALEHIGALDSSLVRPTLGAAKPFYYRNKVQFPVVSVRGSFRVLAGYYRTNSHDLVNIKHCPIQPEPLDRMLAAVKSALENCRIPLYDEATHRGLVRHICARYSFAAGQMLVTLVLRREAARGLPLGFAELAGAVMEACPEVAGVCVNFNPADGNRVMGRCTVPVSGATTICECLASALADAPPQLRKGLTFPLSPTSFFQVSSDQAAVLLDEVLKAATEGLGGGRLGLVVDAYAGVGTIAMWLAPIAARVLAIEEEPQAVADGRVALRLNEINNVEFLQGQVEKVIPGLAGGAGVDLVVLDPPRKGVDAHTLKTLLKFSPPRLIYVSCNPATLARDLRILVDGGYKIKRVQPLDMFPQSYHVESVALLDRE